MLTVASRDAQEVESLREELHISVEPAAAVHCKPVRSFEEANFPKSVLASCKCVGSHARAGTRAEPSSRPRDFKQPSPIQAQCWPIIMRGASFMAPRAMPTMWRLLCAAQPRPLCAAGYDLVGIAATGSGKTLAFVRCPAAICAATLADAVARCQVLPILVHIAAQPKAKIGEPIALVLAPTRELAMQTAEVAEKSGALCNVYSACIYGGAPKGPQYAALKKGAQIVVATPGRLKDLMMEGAVSLGRTTFLVLDEADRMLDLGFEPEIRALAGAIRADRQTVMFSATWPNSIQALAQEFLAEPLMVRIGAEGTRASHSITQIVEVIDAAVRDARLEQLLMQYQGDKASSRRCIIFVLYKKEVHVPYSQAPGKHRVRN
jgi:ATP-dependent RNA helicase DBP3